MQEVRVQPAGGVHKTKRAVYSVEIKVERDRTTGQTRVLSSQTKLPVDCSHGGVKVYEDEEKVVHEVNGQDGVHPLSASEVDELILKADQAAVTAGVDETTESPSGRKITAPYVDGAAARSPGGAEFTGPEASARDCGATRKPVTAAPVGYRNVGDRDGAGEDLTPQGGVVPTPEGNASSSLGGPEAEAAKEPEAAAAPISQTEKRESAGGAAVTTPKEEKALLKCHPSDPT
ncbi:paralemmin 1a [Syngnathoides biaculeatus]|uniref:paralemmin 1a n=1 Tax=Syngnathoides biaculeatus TaxID=300417 RepID=UPI002ADDD3A8|nr:paralemmin 1a [Syngnathoides biaculeatus]